MTKIYELLTKRKYSKLFSFIPVLHLLYILFRLILQKYLYKSKEYAIAVAGTYVLFSVSLRFLPPYFSLIILYCLVSILAIAAQKRMLEFNMTPEIANELVSWKAIQIPVIVISILVLLVGSAMLHSSRVSDDVMELYAAMKANDQTALMNLIHPSVRSDYKDFLAERHAAAQEGLFDGEVEMNRTHSKVTYSGDNTITYYFYEIVCDDGIYSLELEHLKNSRGSGFTLIDFSLPADAKALEE